LENRFDLALLIAGQIKLFEHVVEFFGSAMTVPTLGKRGHRQHHSAPIVRMRLRVDFIGTPLETLQDLVGSGGSPNVYKHKNTTPETMR